MFSGHSHPTQRRYPPELRDRGVRMVWAAIEENDGNRNGVIRRVARQLGVGVESLRDWVNQAEVDRGSKPGTSSEERRRINELEVSELGDLAGRTVRGLARNI